MLGKIRIIKQTYSSSVIIVDEAQHLRAKYDSKEKGEKYGHEAIDLISKYAENVKIVFLTATPMFDNPTELIWMINVLSRVNNDDIEELDEKDFFYGETKGYAFKEQNRSKFIRAIKGKISFLRGGNPSNFPLKLIDFNGINELPSKSFLNIPIIEKDRVLQDSTKLTISTISHEHFNTIMKIKNDNIDLNQTDSFHMQMMQLHNVGWYTKSSSTDDVGGYGLSKHFNIDSKNGVYEPKDINFLNKLQDYAPKIQTIVNHILEMKNGIAFIFTQFISSGLIPMILALEAHGFAKYDGKDNNFHHLQIPKHKQKSHQGNYIVITSSPILATNRMLELVQASKSSGNEQGQKIKVIIASGAGSEGIDLKWIRQVHIMEPFFHFSQIEQAEGRAFRNNSHIELKPENRNCTVYYHATKYPDLDMETIDMYLYRKSIRKRHATNVVRKMIQENSITCEFFKTVNSFDYNKFIGNKITDSKGKTFEYTKDMIIDEGYSNTCNTCQQQVSQLDTDTYDPKIHSTWELYATIGKLQDLFKINDIYTLTDLEAYLNDWDNEIDKETLYTALDILIHNKMQSFKNQFNINGKIVFDGNFYRFQPDYYEYTGIQSSIPILLANSNVNLDTIPWPDRPTVNTVNKIIKTQKILDDGLVKELETFLLKTLEKDIFSKDGFWSNMPQITKQLLSEIIIDRLSVEERKKLFFLKPSPFKIQTFEKALQRYNINNGFLEMSSFAKGYNIVNEKGDIIEYNISKPTLQLSKFIGYNDLIQGKGSFYVRDSRPKQGERKSKKPSGWKLLTTQKEAHVIPTIHYLLKYPYDGKTSLMEYDRYVADSMSLSKGQLHHTSRKKNWKTEDMITECELLFRLLDKKDVSQRWFLNPWEAYDYSFVSKDKTQKNVKKTVLK